MTRYPLFMRPGDNEVRVFQYLDPTDTVVSLVGYTATFTGVVNGTSVTVNGTVDGINGKVQATLSAAQTNTLGAAGVHGNYYVTVFNPGALPVTIAIGPLSMLTQ